MLAQPAWVKNSSVSDELQFVAGRPLVDKLKFVGHSVVPRLGYCFPLAVDSIVGRDVALIVSDAEHRAKFLGAPFPFARLED